MSYNKPLPRLDLLTTPFWDLARQKTLALQTCKNCGHQHLPPSPVCPQCLSSEQEWKSASGRGVLEAHAQFHRAYWPGFAEELPYSSAIIRLEEGPLMAANLVGDPSKAKSGANVCVVFETVTEDLTLPRFKIVPD